MVKLELGVVLAWPPSNVDDWPNGVAGLKKSFRRMPSGMLDASSELGLMLEGFRLEEIGVVLEGLDALMLGLGLGLGLGKSVLPEASVLESGLLQVFKR